mmetsp:Transcript_4487/g.7974  ORF Transcript_4487/g.7974 Transcript_4487/m.7974 type:complete len:203 (+) Transcript_4487:558-1166(+)
MPEDQGHAPAVHAHAQAQSCELEPGEAPRRPDAHVPRGPEQQPRRDRRGHQRGQPEPLVRGEGAALPGAGVPGQNFDVHAHRRVHQRQHPKGPPQEVAAPWAALPPPAHHHQRKHEVVEVRPNHGAWVWDQSGCPKNENYPRCEHLNAKKHSNYCRPSQEVNKPEKPLPSNFRIVHCSMELNRVGSMHIPGPPLALIDVYII